MATSAPAVDTHDWSCLKLKLTLLYTPPIPPCPDSTLWTLCSSSSLCAVFLKSGTAESAFHLKSDRSPPSTIETPLDLHGFTLISASFSLSVWAGRLFIHSHIRVCVLTLAGGRSPLAVFVYPQQTSVLSCFPPSPQWKSETTLSPKISALPNLFNYDKSSSVRTSILLVFCHISGNYFLLFTSPLSKCIALTIKKRSSCGCIC